MSDIGHPPLDTSGDGKADNADMVDGKHDGEIDAATYKTNDLDSDGDGIVDGADDADTVDGKHAADLQSDPATYIWCLTDEANHYRLDIAANSWATMTGTPSNPSAGVTLVKGDDGFNYSGDDNSDVYQYDISADSWNTLAQIPNNPTDDAAFARDAL